MRTRPPRALILTIFDAGASQAGIGRTMNIADAQSVAGEMQIKYGDQALHIAADYANACRNAEDMTGFYAWNLVCAMIMNIEARSRPPNPASRNGGS